jgi:hypothetical protein
MKKVYTKPTLVDRGVIASVVALTSPQIKVGG